MSRWIVTGVLALLAAGSFAAAVEAFGDVLADPSARTWSVAGFVLLRTAVLAAVSVCVFIRGNPRRHSRAPIAFAACAVALISVPLLEKPSEAAQTSLVVAGDLIAFAAWSWLLVSFLALGRCFGLLPEARGLVTRGPYRLVRHPVYLGEFGAVAGLVLASTTTRNVLLAVGFAAAQAVRMRLEERELTHVFPEYASYASRTPRLVPRFWPRTERGAAIAGLCLATALIACPVGATAAKASLAAPSLVAPAAGIRADGVPWFGWAPVAGAAQYEFQIAADAGMNAPVLGTNQDRFFTKNTRATLKKSLPDRTYWWRVRAATAKGAVSKWTAPRAFTKALPAPRPQSPVGGAQVSYPSTALKLVWTPVDRATKYLVTLAADPALASVVGGKPVETFATAFTRSGALAPGTYYWGVTPVDAQGNPGTPSAVSSFVWAWPSSTAVRVNDLVAAPEVFDPQFSWDPIPGAARYEFEVNTSQDFAPGSKVCCAGTTIGALFSPTNVLKDNRYYWRVRGYDVDGNPGVWNEGPVFDKRFDKVPPVADVSIKNVRMRDNVADPGSDLDPGTPASYETQIPMITWDPVPGAASYQVEVAPMGPVDCNWTSTSSHWVVNTGVNAWTPLGAAWNGVKPYFDPITVGTDFPALIGGTAYCARVRARTNRDLTGGDVYGDYTYVVNGRGQAIPGPAPAFRWLGPPSGAGCTPSCNPGYLGAADYVTPATGTLSSRTPYFTWKPIAGKASYFVLVAKDAQFSNIVDYAFTQLPVYSPRNLFRAATYPDETTSYYWAVLPADMANGGQAVGNPLQAEPRSFEKRSTPPGRLEPAVGSDITGHPTFRWTSVEGARRYRVQVAQDDRFATLLEDVLTDSTSYTSNTTYPADTVLYWRVRADDEYLIGLTWSTTGTFQKRLETPRPSASNPSRGDYIPTWTWDPVQGAVSYDVHVDLPDGTQKDLTGARTPVVTPVLMYGTGVFRWKVRANFPRQPFGTVSGPYSATHVFTRTIAEPTGVHSDASHKYPLLLWDPKPGPKNYQVQISTREDFSTLVESVATDNTNYAPLLTHPAYAGDDPIFWRVAAVDEGRNVGDWSPTQRIGVVRRMKLKSSGTLKRRTTRTILITVLSGGNRPLAGATVRVSGAGAKRMAHRTTRRGTVTFRVRPRLRGSVVFRATKSGYGSATLKLRVR